jgi:bacillopeptidase F
VFFAPATAICLEDELPGTGDFPISEDREVDVVPVVQKLPFLFSDRTAPAAPSTPMVTDAGSVTLNWSYDSEPDLAGYRVYRSSSSGGGYQPIGPFLARPFLDTTPPLGKTAYYVVRAFDTSGNESTPSPEVSEKGGER